MTGWSKPEDYIDVYDEKEYIILVLKESPRVQRVIQLKPHDADYIVRQLTLLLQKRSLDTV